MNNKETLQLYNGKLNSNNLALDEILNTINNLPEAGGELNLQNKSITITENGTQTITSDTNYDGLNSVEITTNVSSTTNKTYLIKNGIAQTDYEYVRTDAEGVSGSFTENYNNEGYAYATSKTWSEHHLNFKNYSSIKEGSKIFINFKKPKSWTGSYSQYGGGELIANFVDNNEEMVYQFVKTNEASEEIKTSLLGITRDVYDFYVRIANLAYTSSYEEYGICIYDLWIETTDTLNLQEKTIEINDEYMLDIIPDEGFYGLSKVSIKVNPNRYTAYQMLEYIKGTSYVTGSNYFLTGLYPSNKTTLEMKYAFYKNDNNYSNLYGSSRRFLAQSTTANDTRVVALWNEELIGNMSSMNNFNAHIIKQDKNVMYFDGSVFKTCTDAEWQDENELLLFGCPGGQDASAILYYCKIWEDDVLVRDFVPCYRKSDNSVGLLDKVENKFYENAGTVAFEKGNDITS